MFQWHCDVFPLLQIKVGRINWVSKNGVATDVERSAAEVEADDSIELPNGSKVISIVPSGASPWVKTVKMNVRLTDGSTKPYFMKVSCTVICDA